MGGTSPHPQPLRLLETEDTLSKPPLALRSGTGQALSPGTSGRMCKDPRMCEVMQGWLNRLMRQNDGNAALGPRHLPPSVHRSRYTASPQRPAQPLSTLKLPTPGWPRAVSPQTLPMLAQWLVPPAPSA